MANKKNKKVPVSATPTGFKTGNKRTVAPAQQPEKKPMSQRSKTVLVIVAAILVVALIVTLVFTVIIPAIENSKVTDYYKDNLSKYIDLPESAYKNIKVDVPFEEFSEDDVICKINKLIAANKNEDPEWMGGGIRDVVISPGDVVSIRYRGYTLDADGNESDFAGGSNFTSLTSKTLEIGSGGFIAGFEDALVGINPVNTPEFVKVTEGEVEEGDVVYLSYTAYLPNGKDKTASYERLDLSRDDIDETYGEGFKSFILGLTINESETYNVFDYGDDGDAAYTDLAVNFVTRCEAEPITISVTFPADYTEVTLRGVDAIFDIYIDYVVDYSVSDGTESNAKVSDSVFSELYTLADYKAKLLTDEFITKTLGITEKYLSEGTGDTVVDKFLSALEKEVREEIDDVNETIVLDKIWETLQDNVVIKKYPEDTVEYYYNLSYSQITSFYNKNSSSYDSLDEAAVAYLNLTSDSDWEAYLLAQARASAIDKVIFFYIIREENFIPSEDKYASLREETIDEEMVYWIEARGEGLEELEGEAYDKRVAELRTALIEYLGEDGLKELVYYNYGSEMMVKHLVAK